MTIELENKKAKFNFTLTDKFEAGIMLAGWEAKQLKAKQFSFTNSYVSVYNNEAFLHSLSINNNGVDTPNAKHKLLLNKKEIDFLKEKTTQDGFTIVPTKVYEKNNKFKVEISIAKGKKHQDKRESEKKNTINQQIKQTLKRRVKK